MNKKEKEIYDRIINLCNDKKERNDYVISLIAELKIKPWNEDLTEKNYKENVEFFCEKEYKLIDYLDKRMNLMRIPNYCEDTWEKIDRKRIKDALLKLT